uniref:LNS2/PITP domain-containing protein n=1 Tax=Ananas comosus var. bracteatus TaxID=296719 RepID=A0A6V7PV82_ANACO|nr:unnamed protein product [Ananas comosus var. bracteatus]
MRDRSQLGETGPLGENCPDPGSAQKEKKKEKQEEKKEKEKKESLLVDLGLLPQPLLSLLEAWSLLWSFVENRSSILEDFELGLELPRDRDYNGHEVKLSDSASRPEGLLRLHATQPSPTKPIPNVETRHIEHSSSERSKLRDSIVPWPIRANQGKELPPTTHRLQRIEEEQKVLKLALVYIPSTQLEYTTVTAGNVAHYSEKGANYNPAGRTSTGKQKRLQGLCFKDGEKFFSGRQCKHRIFNTLKATKGVDKGVEPEAAKGETYRKLQVAIDDEEARSVGKCEAKLEQVRAGLSREETFKSCLDLMSPVENEDSEETTGLSSLSEEQMEKTEINTISNLGNDVPQNLESKLEDLKHSASVDISQDDDKLNLHVVVQEGDLVKNTETETTRIETESCELLVTSKTSDNEILRSTPESSAIKGELNQVDSPTLMKQASGLGFEISLCGNLLRPCMGRASAKEVFEAYRISEEEFVSSGPTIIKNTNLIVRVEDKYLPWAKIQHVVLGKAVFGPNFSAELKDAIPVENDETADGVSPSVSRRWKPWPIPFRISRSFQHSDSKSSNEDIFLDSESVLQSPTVEEAQSTKSQSLRKQFVRTNIPTNEQIASLNLKEGQNMIAFKFSTRVLGKQQVDAHIYLWKWNARIVISDVDGTITKSDVLGQFMPLVGKDWTQSGVARLFSAIKENGYQLLFLSARAIVQAYLTRSFLLNLKQDGNALPSGSVVISPDDLFPSLFREVIRRAPHEFKIACLQDIKAFFFPSNYNPFYASFGNRDTGI